MLQETLWDRTVENLRGVGLIFALIVAVFLSKTYVFEDHFGKLFSSDTRAYDERIYLILVSTFFILSSTRHIFRLMYSIVDNSILLYRAFNNITPSSSKENADQAQAKTSEDSTFDINEFIQQIPVHLPYYAMAAFSTAILIGALITGLNSGSPIARYIYQMPWFGLMVTIISLGFVVYGLDELIKWMYARYVKEPSEAGQAKKDMNEETTSQNKADGKPENKSDPLKLYMKERWQNQKDYYSKNSRTNKQVHQNLQFLIAFGSILVPILLTIPEMPNLIPAAVSGFVALLTAAETVYGYGTNWQRYRMTNEELKREKFLYETRSGDYAVGKQADADHLFVVRCEEIIAKETQTFFTSRDDSVKKGSATPKTTEGKVSNEEGDDPSSIG